MNLGKGLLENGGMVRKGHKDGREIREIMEGERESNYNSYMK